MIRGRRRLTRASAVLLLGSILPLQVQSSPWGEIARGGTRVRFSPGDSLRAERVLTFLLSQPPLPALPPGVPSRALVYLAPDEATLLALTGGRVPDWGAGVALPGQETLVVPVYASGRSSVGGGTAVLRHEWAHLGLHAWLDGLRVPRWFDEGYAIWAEGGFDASQGWRLRLLLALGRAPPLDSLSLEWPADRASAEVAYLLSASAIAYLVEASGERGMRVLLRRWRDTGSFETALRGTYGVTSGQLEADWQRWVERRFGWLLVLSHSLAFWALTGLVLAALAWGRRRRTRERMARMRAAEPAETPRWWASEDGEGLD